MFNLILISYLNMIQYILKMIHLINKGQLKILLKLMDLTINENLLLQQKLYLILLMI